MKIKNKIISAVLIVSVLACAALYINLDRAAVWIFAKTYNLDIKYKTLTKPSSNEFLFGDASVIERNSGMGIRAKSARIRPEWREGILKDVAVSFDLYDVNFIPRSEAASPTYDTISGLVASAFSSGQDYAQLHGVIMTSRKGVVIENLIAKSGDIKLLVSGTVGYDKTIDTDCTIYFSNNLKKNIPKELTDVILREEKDGWSSLFVHLAGNYSAPAINVSGKLFRLNIRGGEK